MTNIKISAQLKDLNLTTSTINTGEIFYSGFDTEKSTINEETFLNSRYAIWLTKSLIYAGEYSYRTRNCQTRKIVKIKIEKEIELLEFPLNFHPAYCFYDWQLINDRYVVDYMKPKDDMPIDVRQPDHYFDKNFNEILNLMNFNTNIYGYIRRALPEDEGFKAGEIKEFALIDKTCKKIISVADLPQTKDEFKAFIVTHSGDLDNAIFVKT